ncbi:MAG: phage terminase large subunit [Planctomycetales bacterium]|nr:phage terminase large subunit [bacterium]UNM09514.1 MAG: phage terminase large subunit [Planctomycetales bacterium]
MTSSVPVPIPFRPLPADARIAILREQARRSMRSDLLRFCAVCLPDLLGLPFGRFQHELAAQLLEAMQPGHRLAGALPREHAKTTIGTLGLVLHQLCCGDKRNILIVCANREEAQARLRMITTELERNRLLHFLFGERIAPALDARGTKVSWNDSQLILAGGQRLATIGALGRVRGQLSNGSRLDLVVLDDPEDDDMVRSAEQRDRLSHWLDHALVNALDITSGSLVWLGTLLHHDSALARLMQRIAEGSLPHWQSVRLAALDDEGRPLWPQRWTVERLEQRRQEIGHSAFSQEYMNRPVSLAQQVFREGDFARYAAGGVAIRPDGIFLGNERLRISIGVDPAIGQGDRHDWFCAAVLGTDDAGQRLFLLDMQRARLRFAEQIALLERLNELWRPQRIGIENTAYQAVLSQAALDRGLPAVPLPAHSRKELRLDAMAVQVQRGRLAIPDSAHWLAAFLEEALHYPAGAHDDQLDALARAMEVAPQQAGGMAGKLATAAGRRRGMAVLAGTGPADDDDGSGHFTSGF